MGMNWYRLGIELTKCKQGMIAALKSDQRLNADDTVFAMAA
jgi:hypothetical protein